MSGYLTCRGSRKGTTGFWQNIMGHGCVHLAAQSVRLLTDLLYVYYGHKPIILLDEYDTPLQEAYFNSFLG